MKKLLLSFAMAIVAVTMAFGQGDILINDFTTAIDPAKIYGDNYDAGGAPNQSLISVENNMLKAAYVWNKPDWYPRAVWYHFDNYIDVSDSPIMEVKFMVEDNDNDSIQVRFDLYGDGAEEFNGAIQDTMEANGNPWELYGQNGEWHVVGSDFIADNRFFCTYFGTGIDPVRVDSTKIKGFEAFAHYGSATANQAGTLWIDYIKMTDVLTGVEQYLVGGNRAFGLAIYPSPTSDYLKINSENAIERIEIYNITGKLINSVQGINERKYEIGVSELPEGLYITNITDTNGKTVSEKFIKN